MKNRQFIWLNKELYPEYLCGKFCVAEFKKEFDASAPFTIDISAHARYMLFINGEYVGRGPHTVGGDFLEFAKIEVPYYDTYKIDKMGKIQISVLVTSVPTAMDEYNFGVSGLYLEAYDEKTVLAITDESWDARLVAERKAELYTDYREEKHSFSKAEFIDKAFDLSPIELEHLTEEYIAPISFSKITVEKGKSAKTCVYFDKIYSAYPYVKIACDGECTVKLISTEEGRAGRFEETVVTSGDVLHFSPRMRSIGQIEVEVINSPNATCVIEELYIHYIHYPVHKEAPFRCSDPLINQIYDLCMHTLKLCRQSIHLDSPTHQEPLACTGDYFIQSLIEYLSLGDPTLAKCDLKRTANLLKVQDGRLFHTSYSLLYPWWAYEHFMHTGDAEIVDLEALSKLAKRFDSYVCKENGLLEYVPDYMFVDWVVASCDRDEFLDGGKMMSHGKMEGYSLHHPPKALGQSVLCMFYYNALLQMASLFSLGGDLESGEWCRLKALEMKNSINEHLFDRERGLYVGGLNTPNMVEENQWLPKNTKTVYYLKQANTLAVLFGIAPKSYRKQILEYVVTDLSKFEMQPYFYHFLLNALINEDMFGEYGMELIRKYKSLIDRCPKGLSEAWENMECDYSHAWGAAPAYTLKRALSGLEILEPGFRKIKLAPRVFDLESAELEITTPFGEIEISVKKGGSPSVKVPNGILLEQ